jgi:hypothetical protein
VKPERANTAAASVQALIREVWASGSTIADLTKFVGISKDQFIRLRGLLDLPLRLDRSQRAKPARERITWQVVEQRKREIREGWDEATEYDRRVVKNSSVILRVVEMGTDTPDDDNPLETLADDCK